MRDSRDGEMLNFEIRWINKPPIMAVDEAEYSSLCKELARAVKKDYNCGQLQSGDSKDILAWELRVADSERIAKLGRYECYDRHFAYVVAGRTIGVMAMSGLDETTPCIEILVTHPGSAGCGGILVEYAVNLSKDAGYGGCLELFAMPRSVAAYLALGFVMTEACGDGGLMKLDPAKSGGKWVKLDNSEWRLTKYLKRGQFAA
jgi:hypothetical protein